MENGRGSRNYRGNKTQIEENSARPSADPHKRHTLLKHFHRIPRLRYDNQAGAKAAWRVVCTKNKSVLERAPGSTLRMTQQRNMVLEPGRPLNKAVAIVDSALDPVVQALCLILLKAGMRLVLYDCEHDHRSVAVVAKDLNLLMGCDPNHMDATRGSWGCSRVIAAQVDDITTDTARGLVTGAISAFGKSPDVVVDVKGSLQSDFIVLVLKECSIAHEMKLEDRDLACRDGSMKSEVVTVMPFKNDQLLMHGQNPCWDERHEDVKLASSEEKQPCLYVLCGNAVAVEQSKGHDRMQASSHSQMTTRAVLSSDPIASISHIVSGGTWCPHFKIVDGSKKAGSPCTTGQVDAGLQNACNHEEKIIDNGSSYQSQTVVFGREKEAVVKDEIRCLVPDKCGEDRNIKPPQATLSICKSVAQSIQECPDEIIAKEALGVLDCRCQYEIMQEMVKGSIHWLVFGYILVMVTIPRLFAGSYVGL